LIVPISYFIEKPFQNWTRISTNLLGTVLVHADYTIPVEAVRQELRRIVEQSSNWDGKVCGLQVTGASERTVQLRALVSASGASRLWDLRCEVREHLLAFLQEIFPDSLPKLRTQITPARPDATPDTAAGRPPTEGAPHSPRDQSSA